MSVNINSPEDINELRRALNNYQETAASDTDQMVQATLLAADDLAEAASAVLDILLDENGLPPTLAALVAMDTHDGVTE